VRIPSTRGVTDARMTSYGNSVTFFLLQSVVTKLPQRVVPALENSVTRTRKDSVTYALRNVAGSLDNVFRTDCIRNWGHYLGSITLT
jgi:hypothetical protein